MRARIGKSSLERRGPQMKAMVASEQKYLETKITRAPGNDRDYGYIHDHIGNTTSIALLRHSSINAVEQLRVLYGHFQF